MYGGGGKSCRGSTTDIQARIGEHSSAEEDEDEALRGMRRVGNKMKNGEAKGESDRGAMDNSIRGRITR